MPALGYVAVNRFKLNWMWSINFSFNFERGGLYTHAHMKCLIPLTGAGGDINAQTTSRLLAPVV